VEDFEARVFARQEDDPTDPDGPRGSSNGVASVHAKRRRRKSTTADNGAPVGENRRKTAPLQTD
jgi:hypothetical protein